jgi:hypothetical protein
MADYHEIPTEEMPDYVPDEYSDTDDFYYDDYTDSHVSQDESAETSYEISPDELDNIYGGWSLPRLFALMIVLVIIGVILIQLLVPAAYQVLHPPPTPTLRPPWMA